MEGGVVEGRVELGVEREVRAEMQGGTVSVQHRPGRRCAVRTEREQPGGERRPQRLVGQQRVHAGHQVNTADSRDNNKQIRYQTSSEQHIGICDKVPFLYKYERKIAMTSVKCTFISLLSHKLTVEILTKLCLII